MKMTKFLNVDEFIDGNCAYDLTDRGDVNYARWVLLHKRLPAVMKYDFDEFMADHKLFCTYEDIRYRCTGGSRMGDVWLTTDFDQDTGYELRVAIDDCFHWSRTSKSKKGDSRDGTNKNNG
jgi:hypothetical protein